MGQVAVYKKGTIDFYNQGLGILSDVLSSELTQIVNSSGTVGQQLVLEYPTDGYLANQLVEGNLLRVSISKDKEDYGIFEINDTLKSDGGTLTIYGDPYYNRILRMSFDNGGIFTTYPNVQVALDTARMAITGFPAGFALISNLGKSVDLSGKNYENFGDFLETLVSACGGNVKYTVNGIQIYSALGRDIKDITLRDDMNTSSVKVKTDYSGIINKVIPILPSQDSEGNSTQETVVGKVVTSKYGHQFLDYWAGKVISFDTQDLANSYFDRTHADRPVQTVEVEPLDMDEDFSAINIFDRITLYSTKLDYKDKLRVSERVFDTLSEEVKSFKLGSSTANVFNQINEQQDQLFNNIKNITNALISANGKGLDYFGQAEPENPKEGDLWFFDDGVDAGIKQFINGEWVVIADLATAKRIQDSVKQTLIDAQNYSDKLVADNAEQVNRVLSDVQDKQVELKNEQLELDRKAQEYANKALSDAKAEALETTQGLVSSIQTEVENRVKAVSDLDKKAQGYVASAKTELTTTINKEVTDRTNALTALDTKTTTAINQAKADAQSAVNALQVGGRNYFLNSKTLSVSYLGNNENKATVAVEAFDTDTNMWHLTAPQQAYSNAGIWLRQGAIKAGQKWALSFDVKGTGNWSNYGARIEGSTVTKAVEAVTPDWSRVSVTGTKTVDSGAVVFYFDLTNAPLDVYIKLPKLEIGNMPTAWTPAPEDVVLDYTTKDNVIKQSLTQYQEANDGRVTKAQSDITQALGELSTKVSQTTFNTKTSDLETKYTNVKQTADKATTDIVAIKTKDNSQDTRMANIEADANGLRSTVSSIQTTQGQQAGSISTLQQRADGFDATVTKVNNMAVGGRNLLLNSKSLWGVGGNNQVTWTTEDFDTTTKMWHLTSPQSGWLNVGIYFYQPNKTSYQLVKGDKWAFSFDIKGSGTFQTYGSENSADYSGPNGDVPADWKRVFATGKANNTNAIILYFDTRTKPLDVYIKLPKLELGTLATAWTPAPEDLEGATAHAQLTADNATTTINNYKTSNDGRVSNAESKITQNAQAITQKVSQTTFDTKTGQLQTDLNTTTATANQAKTDIVAIKSKDNAQDARMTSIESDANGTKTTVSNLQTEQNKQSGAISTLQQRANGFDATVTKVNNMSVGGRNLVVTANLVKGWIGNGVVVPPSGTQANTMATDFISVEPNSNLVAQIWYDKAIDTSDNYFRVAFYDADKNYLSRMPIHGSSNTYNKWVITTPVNTAFIRASFDFLANEYGHAKIEKGNMATDWTPAPEDLEGATARAQLTADNATTTINSYKTSNDGRVASAESKITQNTNAINQKVSQADYNTKTGQIDSQISSIKQTATSISQSVSNVQTQVNDLKQINMVINSEFSPDLAGWYVRGTASRFKSISNAEPGFNKSGSVTLDSTGTGTGNVWYTSALYAVPASSQITVSAQMKMTVVSNQVQLGFIYYNESNTAIAGFRKFIAPSTSYGLFTHTATIPADARYVSFDILLPESVKSVVSLSQPMMVIGSSAGGYVPGQYNNNDKIATQQITLDSISNVVSNPTTGLSKRVQTAEGTLSQVHGVDIPALQKATYWQPYSSLDFNSYTKQGSYFFDTTATKTNGPTSSTAWTYLIVEQGRNNSDRVTQTAWYDGSNNKVTYRRAMTSGTWGAWYASDNDSATSISQMNGVITQEVKDRQTGDSNTLTQAKSFTTSSITSSENGIKSLITQTSDSIIAQIGTVNQLSNTEFTPDFSDWLKEWDWVNKVSNPDTSMLGLDTFTFKQSNILTVDTSKTSQVIINRPIEIPANCGPVTFSAYISTTDNYSGRVASRVRFYDASRKHIGTTSGNTATSNRSMTYVTETFNTVPTGAKYMAFIFGFDTLSGTIRLSKPQLVFGDKAVAYTPNNAKTGTSTILSLLKDNWSIGIADNISNITSGIVGNANSMSLISNKVIINAPQTQIKGTAWITSAMIANGQIGTAQIGDASITSAKIHSLDVNKITGNISSWILSQWTSATGNKVTIDGNGMYFSPGASRMTKHGFEAWRPDSSAGGGYAAMGMLGSYAWETNSNINGIGLFGKFHGVPHDDNGSPYKGEVWGGDTIAIGAVQPQSGNGFGYIEPYMIFPANNEVGNMYRPNNNSDTLILSRWLSIYTGLNMRGNSIVNSSGYSLKENFKPVSGKEALDVFDNTDIMSYDYKPDSEEMDERTEANRKDKVGFIINDNGQSPFKTDPRLVRYGNTRDDSVTVGYLMSAVKELHSRIKELEAQQGK